jgi:hypothetical protein
MGNDDREQEYSIVLVRSTRFVLDLKMVVAIAREICRLAV